MDGGKGTMIEQMYGMRGRNIEEDGESETKKEKSIDWKHSISVF